MNALKQWLSTHSITAKTFVSGWIFIDALFYTSPQFHDYVLNAYNALPAGLHGVIAGVLIPALIFWRTQKRSQATLPPSTN